MFGALSECIFRYTDHKPLENLKINSHRWNYEQLDKLQYLHHQYILPTNSATPIMGTRRLHLDSETVIPNMLKNIIEDQQTLTREI